MGSSRAAVAFSIVLALAAPAAAATWGVKGLLEPSTGPDRRDGYMFPNPDQSAGSGRHVYFNGFMGAYAAYATHFSPNAAALGTSVQPYPAEAWAALGVWKDCNRDGFIGHGDQGLWEYPVELLSLPGGPGESVCPNEGPIDPRFPFVAPGWTPPHNDGDWVHEFIAIGWRDWRDSVDLNPWAFNDSDARVWADHGLPGQAQTLVCSVDPAPRGTYQSTGGLLAYSDCLTGYKATATLNVLAQASPLLEPVSFADQPMGRQGESRSVLNQRNPWGRQQDAALVGAWDCASPPLYQLKDPTWSGRSGPTHQGVANPAPAGDRTLWVNLSDAEGNPGFSATGVGGAFVTLNVSQPRGTPGVDPSGSAAGTVNDTQSSYGNCRRDDNAGPGASHAPYSLEGNAVVQGSRRVSTDFSLHYEMGRSRAGPHALTGRGAPPDWGVKLTGREACYSTGVLYQVWCYDGLWHDVALSDATRVASQPNPYADRASLTPQPVMHVTFYASVGAAATSQYGFRFPGATGAYGAEGCAAGTLACDPAEWWPGATVPRTPWLGSETPQSAPDCQGTATGGCMPYGVRVGKPYQLRDVDCFDQSATLLRENGLTWGTVTGTECV